MTAAVQFNFLFVFKIYCSFNLEKEVENYRLMLMANHCQYLALSRISDGVHSRAYIWVPNRAHVLIRDHIRVPIKVHI